MVVDLVPLFNACSHCLSVVSRIEALLLQKTASLPASSDLMTSTLINNGSLRQHGNIVTLSSYYSVEGYL